MMGRGRKTRGFARWWTRCTRWRRLRHCRSTGSELSPLRQLYVNNGMEIDQRGVIRPRPWHDPGPFRHFTRDIYGRDVVAEYTRKGKPPEVTPIGQYARGGVQ